MVCFTRCSYVTSGLYDNVNGQRDAFANFWTKTATYFKDKPILGYEIINEPWCGDMYANPTLLLPGNASQANALPSQLVFRAPKQNSHS